MKYTEKKIASFQFENQRWQLLEITNEIIGTDGIPTDLKEVHFQIRKNRRIITNSKCEEDAKIIFSKIINNELSQLKLLL